jgi:hypothetical protein
MTYLLACAKIYQFLVSLATPFLLHGGLGVPKVITAANCHAVPTNQAGASVVEAPGLALATP